MAYPSDNPFSGFAAPSQADTWLLESKSPQPQPLFKTTVAGVSAAWPIIYPVPQGSYVQLQEILMFNGTAGDVEFRFAFLDDDDAIPSGATLGQDNVLISETVASGAWKRLDLATGLLAKWRIAAWSDAASGEKATVLGTGLVVTYL